MGLKKNQIFNVKLILQEHNAMWYSIIVSAPSSLSCITQYMSPFIGCTISEYFRDNTFDSLVIYDDLTNQAYAYRQMSLLIGRAPGREAYPGDIFYLHSRLLERSAKLTKNLGLGSLTALPIIETQEENIAAYIPTNVISITDGQIYLSKDLFKNNILPAIDINKSISRIGSKAQNNLLIIVSKNLKENLRVYFDLVLLLQSGQTLDKYQMNEFLIGKVSLSIWLQTEFNCTNLEEQIIFCDKINKDKICTTSPETHKQLIILDIQKKQNL